MQRREVYSLGSLLGEIGGLSGALATASTIVVWLFVHKYFYAKVASKLYKTEKRPKLTIIKKEDEVERGIGQEVHISRKKVKSDSCRKNKKY